MGYRKLFPACLFCLLLLLSQCRPAREAAVDGFHYTGTKKLEVSNGAVVSAHPLASAAGLLALQRGGNAFDAAIATQLALAVVYPQAGNIGGGGFLVAQRANGESLALDYRETAPAAAHRDLYLDAQGNVHPTKSLSGHLSVAVPGTVAGLFETHRYARLPFRQLIEPAIRLAENGFAITAAEAANLNRFRDSFIKYNTVPVAVVRNRIWNAGDTLRQPELAATLRRIRDAGVDGFYRGETARMLLDEMQRGGGLITANDLEHYKAKWRTPLSFSYRGNTVLSMPMPSSGGTLLLQMLRMSEPFPLASYGHNSPAAVQLMTEVERRAFADRAAHMGDADFYPVPDSVLIDGAYLRNRMRDFVPGKASSSTGVGAGTIPPRTSDQTTHLSVIDREGNAVSVTTTLNNYYGSKTVAGGAGFFLNDEMDDFSAKPGAPNLFGAVGGEANAIAPGKRMLSSMTPTIVLRNGKPWIVVGTPGGTTIPTSVFQTLVNLIDFGLDADAAVNRPKFHHQWLPDLVEVERSFPVELRKQLEAMGYALHERPTLGRVELIVREANGAIIAVADGRGDDAAAGY
ncbi:MAG: gamma-glutamyltransferase [Chitinophagaceae bacterium]|nr:MAG: gamma-glutamyltransferase [Chitinophagaceae bacterium]